MIQPLSPSLTRFGKVQLMSHDAVDQNHLSDRFLRENPRVGRYFPKELKTEYPGELHRLRFKVMGAGDQATFKPFLPSLNIKVTHPIDGKVTPVWHNEIALCYDKSRVLVNGQEVDGDVVMRREYPSPDTRGRLQLIHQLLQKATGDGGAIQAAKEGLNRGYINWLRRPKTTINIRGRSLPPALRKAGVLSPTALGDDDWVEAAPVEKPVLTEEALNKALKPLKVTVDHLVIPNKVKDWPAVMPTPEDVFAKVDALLD